MWKVCAYCSHLTSFHYRDPYAPRPNGPRRVGVVALIERERSLLLERRVDAPLWSLIGGSVEDHESLAEALEREVYEETGLLVESYALFGTFSDPSRIVAYGDGNTHRVITLAYRVVVAGFDGLRASDESEDLAFFELDQMDSLDIAAMHRPIIDRLRSSRSSPHLD